jgi:hypothetical protein
MAVGELVDRSGRALAVVRVHEFEQRAGGQLLRRVSERPLERRVHALEVAVESSDAEQVEGEIEDPLDIALGPPAAHDRAAGQERDQRRGGGPEERDPGERRQQCRARLGADVDLPAPRERIKAD